jgi:proteasome lid subunit RPN8/RPN11
VSGFSRTVTVAPTALAAIVAHARDAAPDECCGLLLGSASAIDEAARARNVADDRRVRFLIDPQDHIEARRDARRRRLDVVGFYHSHPRSAAVPSPTDLAEAAYPDHLHLIVSVVSDPPDVRLFRVEQDGRWTVLTVPGTMINAEHAEHAE